MTMKKCFIIMTIILFSMQSQAGKLIDEMRAAYQEGMIDVGDLNKHLAEKLTAINANVTGSLDMMRKILQGYSIHEIPRACGIEMNSAFAPKDDILGMTITSFCEANPSFNKDGYITFLKSIKAYVDELSMLISYLEFDEQVDFQITEPGMSVQKFISALQAKSQNTAVLALNLVNNLAEAIPHMDNLQSQIGNVVLQQFQGDEQLTSKFIDIYFCDDATTEYRLKANNLLIKEIKKTMLWSVMRNSMTSFKLAIGILESEDYQDDVEAFLTQYHQSYNGLMVIEQTLEVLSSNLIGAGENPVNVYKPTLECPAELLAEMGM
jgi:hypothetical protein